jgi:hypothetical protein
MGIKAKIEIFASSKNISLRDYQKSNLRNIERDFETGKIDKNAVVSRVHQEFKKEGRLLSSSEERELLSKIV